MKINIDVVRAVLGNNFKIKKAKVHNKEKKNKTCWDKTEERTYKTNKFHHTKG